jgi:hypothetical protein
MDDAIGVAAIRPVGLVDKALDEIYFLLPVRKVPVGMRRGRPQRTRHIHQEQDFVLNRPGGNRCAGHKKGGKRRDQRLFH